MDTKRTVTSVALFLLLLPIARAEKEGPRLEDLAWLGGCWSGEQPTGTVEEVWMQPADGLMLGMNRQLRKERRPSWEWLAILELDGTLVYRALPAGQAMTDFRLDKLSKDEAVFVNPEHDFPQTIRYLRGEDGRMMARAEGMNEGRMRILSFPMERAKCETREKDD
jgi:hypothetical protein